MKVLFAIGVALKVALVVWCCLRFLSGVLLPY